MEITGKEKNPLLKREEVELSVDHKGKATPSRHDIVKDLAKKLSAKEELLIINKIFTVKGKNESKVSVFVYSKKEDIPPGLLEASKKRMQKKEKPAETKPEGEKPAEEKKEAEKAEEKPEGEKQSEDKPAKEPEEKQKEASKKE